MMHSNHAGYSHARPLLPANESDGRRALNQANKKSGLAAASLQLRVRLYQ
jgi:hypothetical protein